MASKAIGRAGIVLVAGFTATVFLAACQPRQVMTPVGTGMHPAFVLTAKLADGPPAVDAAAPPAVSQSRFQPPPPASAVVAIAVPVSPEDPYAKTPPPARAPPAPSLRIV